MTRELKVGRGAFNVCDLEGNPLSPEDIHPDTKMFCMQYHKVSTILVEWHNEGFIDFREVITETEAWAERAGKGLI